MVFITPFIFGFLLARLLLDRLPGRQVFIALLLLPAVISPIVAGAMWRLMFDNIFGPINQVLSWLAGGPVNILWTVNSNPVIVYFAILVCEIWQWTPFMFLILLAALSNVDRSQLEAAELDGASWWQTLSKVVLPAIKPVVIVALGHPGTIEEVEIDTAHFKGNYPDRVKLCAVMLEDDSDLHCTHADIG